MIHRLFRTAELRSTPPENKNVIWIDTNKKQLKIYENGEWTIYTPEDCVLLEPINLTESQKETARNNIGAISAKAVTNIVDTTVEKNIDKHINDSELIKSILVKVNNNSQDITELKTDVSEIKDTLNWKEIK